MWKSPSIVRHEVGQISRAELVHFSRAVKTYVDSKSFIAGDDTILAASSLCRKGRRSMQLSYAPILGYSFDSTKVAKPIRQPIRRESWSNWNGRNEETDGRNDDPPKKSGGPNKGSTRPATSNFGIDFDGIT